jgi:hypothetical protein
MTAGGGKRDDEARRPAADDAEPLGRSVRVGMADGGAKERTVDDGVAPGSSAAVVGKTVVYCVCVTTTTLD